VQRLGHQLLAGAGLAGHEHGGVGARDLEHLIVDCLHRARGADQPAEPAEPAQLVAQPHDLAAQPRRALHVREDFLEPAHVHRLGEVVGGAAAQRTHGSVDACVTGHEHEVHPGPLPDEREQLERHPVRQLEVGDEQVEVLFLERLARGLERRGGSRLEFLMLDERLHRLEMRELVVDQQRARGGRVAKPRRSCTPSGRS
jgi:hypothetical protein